MTSEFIRGAAQPRRINQEWADDAERQIGRLTGEVERLRALLNVDLVRERDRLRTALDHVVKETDFEDSLWDMSELSTTIAASRKRVKEAEQKAAETDSSASWDDPIPF
ncbi:MAG TPA: hypothetical protein VGL34_25920 [Steroidobacteraceae bacterium]|jgi:hypothetical protein